MLRSIPNGIDLDERTIHVSTYVCANCCRRVVDYGDLKKQGWFICPYCGRRYEYVSR